MIMYAHHPGSMTDRYALSFRPVSDAAGPFCYWDFDWRRFWSSWGDDVFGWRSTFSGVFMVAV